MKRLIFLILTISIVMSGCTTEPPFQHGRDNISYIELVRNYTSEAEVVKQLSGADIIQFMEELEQIECKKSLQPYESLGELLVCIYYSNGDADFIGSNANAFIANGEYTVSGWYHFEKDALVALFDAYSDAE